MESLIKIIIIYFPLGAVGVWRWTIWMTKKLLSLKYKPIRENGYTATLSIITPVYNENPKLFQEALLSWKKNDPNEIIAVIDASDKNCARVFKKFAKNFRGTKLIITKEPGKRPALKKGVLAASGEILALVDSDTVWDKNIKGKILAPFADVLVGGVGTRQEVLEINTLARILFNIHLDIRYIFEMPFLSAMGDAVTCLSGRTAVYRKSAIYDLMDLMENETFMKKKCISGEDKCLTRLVQSRNWKVKYQSQATVRTHGAPDLITFFKQQTRWTRNSFRSDLKSLFSDWIVKEKWLAFHLIDRFIQPFTLILGPIYLILSLILGHYLVAFTLIAWWHISRFIKIMPHLRKNPVHIFMLPLYILNVYIMGIIKIYALITIRKQGWLTRWDKSRLGKLKFVNIIPSYAGTTAVILLITFGVTSYSNTFASLPTDKNIVGGNELFGPLPQDLDTTSVLEETVYERNELGKYGYYTVKKGDTFEKIARKYNADPENIKQVNQNALNPPAPGVLIKIPVSELKNIIQKENLTSFAEPEIIYNEKDDTIYVQNENSVATIPKIYKSLKNKNILEELSNKEWLLKVNLFIGRGVTFVIDGEEVSWLKLLSEKNNFVILRSYNGRMLIKDVKITSWDSQKNAPDSDPSDGRSIILAKYDGRMDVINSEIGYLGYGYYGTFPRKGRPFGGSYGIAWKIPNASFKKYLITGSIINSKIHNNYFGFYSYGATGMIIKDNNVYNNIEYGIDPHDDSNNMTIENNIVYGNGNHGIIVSKRCFNNIFRNNISYSNRLHGIMLDRQSNYNLIENNIVYDNVDGIVFFDSHNNIVRNNEINGNKKSGIRININSSDNYYNENKISKNINGIFLYDNANQNFMIDNSIFQNNTGVYIKNSTKNVVKNSLKKGNNAIDIKLGEVSDGNIIEKI